MSLAYWEIVSSEKEPKKCGASENEHSSGTW